MTPTGQARRVGLVLGAGGTKGGAWIRGALHGLEHATGFTPNQAAVLQGTSIGAFISGRIGPPTPLHPGVFEQLTKVATVPSRPNMVDQAVATGRRIVGSAIAFGCPPGRADPLSWVQEVQDETIASVVSARCRPPRRRVASLAESGDPAREIAASGAVPIGAQPVEIDGAKHTDGAVLSVTNADVVTPDRADLLIVIAPLVTINRGTPVSRSGRHQLRVELDAWASARQPVIVIAPDAHEYRHRADSDRHRAAAVRCVEQLDSMPGS